MFLKNVVIHKTIHIQEINIKNRIYSYYFTISQRKKKQFNWWEKLWGLCDLLCYNHVHSILKIFDGNKSHFYHKWNEAWLLVINWYIQVVSRVAKWFKT